MEKHQFLVSLGRIVKWLERPSVLLITPFILLFPGYRPVSIDLLQDLSQLELRLHRAEAETYFPAELKALTRTIDNVRCQYQPTIRPIDILCTLPLLESGISAQLLWGEELESRTRLAKTNLDTELQLALGLLGTELSQTEGTPYNPELGPLRRRIRAVADGLASFQVKGSYDDNLLKLAQIDRIYADFKRRWIRYNGGVVPDRNHLDRIRQNSHALADLEPRGVYLLIDTSANRLYLRRGREILLEAVCSTGSGYQLIQNGRSWTFQTPRGEFKIERKIESPVWRKPDWAFIESGQSLPVREDLRLEDSVLGEYALGFGGPYFIHGTLYTRLLGEPVTHGCIRLDSNDLEKLYRLTEVGTRIFIY